MAYTTIKSAQADAGKISDRNSKMPGSTFALDSFACKVGEKLSKIEGSVCKGCYARRIQKMRPSVNKGWSDNQKLAVQLIKNAPHKWVAAMVFQIEKSAIKTGKQFHRWFDSGDLNNVDMLSAIVKVCEQTPHISHWLPTRETKIVQDYLRESGKIPANLSLRISATMVGDSPVKSAERLGVKTSTVHRKGESYIGHECPAPKQGNACNDCRFCWTGKGNVSYVKH